MSALTWLVIGLIGAWAGAIAERSALGAEKRSIFLTDVDGAIGVGTSHQITRALRETKDKNGEMLIIRLDTPGGLVSSTREIIKEILASSIPVAVYVAPSGARAASAGTYIAYAAHVSAMASGTHLGAATPIELSFPGMPSGPKSPAPQQEDDNKGAGKEAQSTSERKSVNDAVAFLKTLAELRGRNTEWAEMAVRDAATLTSSAALTEKVTDILSNNIEDLLRQMDGRTVELPDGPRRLQTSGKPVVELEPDWRTRFISAVTDPNIAFILMLIGVYGIIFEFWTPGLAGPGIIGAICLLVGLAALSTLPVNYAGLALLILGILLMAAEAFVPGFGILGLGGGVAFVAGALFLFDPAGADIEFGVGWPVAIGAAITTGALTAGLLSLVVKSRQRAVITGIEELIGAMGVIKEWRNGNGRVHIHGEMWSARGEADLNTEEKVRVVGLDGLTLVVESIGERSPT